MAYLHGQTVEDMKVNILMIRKKVMDNSIGQMAGSTKEVGKMVNSMELELIHQQVAKPNKANGRMVRDYTGLLVITAKNNEFFLSFVT